MRLDIRGTTSRTAGAATALVVGDWYLHSQSAHHDARVIEAYKQLQVETDRLFSLLCGDRGSATMRVVFTRCAKPYETDEELISAARIGRTLEITSASIAGERLHPLLDCEFGGAFDRFRAVHDLIGHVWCGLGFDLGDECAAWSVQDRLHGDIARTALATELLGVNAARSILNEAPDLKALLLWPSACGDDPLCSPVPTLEWETAPSRRAILTGREGRVQHVQIRCPSTTLNLGQSCEVC
jgi:hypothetical protein